MKKPYTSPRCTAVTVRQAMMLTGSQIQTQVIIEDDDDTAMNQWILWGGVSSFDTRPTDEEGRRWGD